MNPRRRRIRRLARAWRKRANAVVDALLGATFKREKCEDAR